MTGAPTTVSLNVLLSDEEGEKPPFIAAAHQLVYWLSRIPHRKGELKVNLLDLGSGVHPAGGVTVISPLGVLQQRHRAFADLAAEHRKRVSALVAAAGGPVFLCTIFRHVPLPPGEERSRLIERIRRINLLCAELSQETGVGVIGIDRSLAHLGAQLLQTDFRLGGQIGRFVSGDVIASALLAAGLDDLLPEDWLDHARRLHGEHADSLARMRLLQSRAKAERRADASA